MRRLHAAVFAALCVSSGSATGETLTSETVYVETGLDTDGDGKRDRIYVRIDRPTGGTGVHSILTISPYALGGNNAPNHNVNVRLLPQDEQNLDENLGRLDLRTKEQIESDIATLRDAATQRGYASLTAHSIGTGNSTGCPSVGDEAETLATKAVIDWLNGRATAYSSLTGSSAVLASWASGNVGMTGVSYNGTLPNMVATTGVEGLKAIVPVAAISDWYDYYRANGLVVGPGGYVGEDADVLGKFIVRRGACSGALARLNRDMGREHGDFTPFWAARDYVARASGVRAAVFIIHGQADWNVRQRHAVRWYEALNGQVPLRMWLHKGGHSTAARSDTSAQVWKWFDRYVKGVENGVEDEPKVEVESPSGSWSEQTSWPSERTALTRMYMNEDRSLAETASAPAIKTFVDLGKSTRLESLVNNPSSDAPGRVAFVSQPLAQPTLLSGTPRMTLDVAVTNRRAANLTVAVVEYDAAGRGKVVTRGWADPQNYADRSMGEMLEPGRRYPVTFELEPKQYTFGRGSRVGIVITATDYDHTLRPDTGTEVSIAVGPGSFVDLYLSGD